MKHLTYSQRKEIQKKEAQKKKTGFLIAFTLMLFGGMLYGFFFSGLLAVKMFDLQGGTESVRRQIQTITNQFLSKKRWIFLSNASNILLFPHKELDALVKNELIEVERLKIEREFFKNKILIRTTLREPVGVYCNKTKDQCFYFDRTGLLFRKASWITGGEVLAIVNQKIDSLQLSDTVSNHNGSNDIVLNDFLTVERLLLEFDLFTNHFFVIPQDSIKDFWIQIIGNYPVYLDTTIDYRTQLLGLKEFFEERPELKEQNFEYIDLRVNGRIYYK